MIYDIFQYYAGKNKKSLKEHFEPQEWKIVSVKSVPDSDGFMTEYAWYTNGYTHIFMFGDSDIVTPDPAYADWECDTQEEAKEWFDSYNGFEDDLDDDFDDPEYFNEDKENIEDFIDKGFERVYGLDMDDNISLKERGDILTEAYNNLPKWFTDFLDNHYEGKAIKRILNSRNIDLANATYVKGQFPRSNRDPQLKDTTRLSIFRIQSIGSQTVYMPGINNPTLRLPSGDWREAKNTPMKDILALSTEYGYIDLNDSRNSNQYIKNQRYSLKRDAGPQRGVGQHPVERTVYATDEYGSKDFHKPIGKEIEWVMTKGQDKSGYPLNPEKYVRMLDNVGLDSYSARLEVYFNKLESIRSRIIAVMNRFSVDNASKFRSRNIFANNVFGDITQATDNLGRAINHYQQLKQGCEDILSRHADKPQEYLNQRINELFKWNAKYVREYIDSALEAVKAVENAEEIVPEE